VHRRRRGDGAGRRAALTLDLLPPAAELAVFAAAVAVLTVTRTLQRGARAGLAAAAGICAGCVVHAFAAAFGLAALLALHPQAFTAIQWAGAAYLVWLGLGLLRQAWRPETRARAAPAKDADSRWADFRSGMFTNVLNPKVAFFFLAFLPQFVPAAAAAKTLSFLALGGWFIVQSFAFLALLVALAARMARLQGSPAVRRALGAAGGILFIGLALRLLRETKPLTA
jgi:threonine/homoserine/homoserine lactone efflux protein